MATSVRQFNVGLYREHLDEASFLYGQRRAYLHDPEVDWPMLRDWEERLEAHIDALVVGGQLALGVCRSQAADGDSGQKHAALRVLCRQKRKGDAFATVHALDPADEETVRALSDALRWEAPREWVEELLVQGPQGRPQLIRPLAQVIGFRRFPCEPFLKANLADAQVGLLDLAWALGRVGSAGSRPDLAALLDSNDDRVCETAAIALMRLGDERPSQRALGEAHDRMWTRPVLGIGGGSRAVGVLLDGFKRGSVDAGSVLALGLLGDLRSVSPLVELLGDEQLSEPAAIALNTITGAGLYAKQFIVDPVEMDEFLPEERDQYEKHGTVLLRQGRAYGNWERRPVGDAAVWRRWLDREKTRFSRNHRWRMGKPYGPAALVECLGDPTAPNAVRSATYEELVIRYGLDVPFEADLPVRQQIRFLGKIRAWLEARRDSFVEGRWYFAGQLQG